MSPEEREEHAEVIRNMVEGGMMLLEVMRPILETLEGYKAELALYGYTEEQQKQMAADLHYMVTRGIAKNGDKS